jgi:hypothetical protein
MTDKGEGVSCEVRNQNAIEVAKILTDELNHYRTRQTNTITSFSALSLLLAGAIQTYNGPLSRGLSALLIVVIFALALWSSELLLITRKRANHARLLRQQLLESVDFPEFNVRGDILGLDFQIPENGGIRFFEPLMGVTALSLLIIVFVALVPMVAILVKIW